MADHIHTSPHSPSFRTETIEITTGSREVALDITDRCARFLDEHAVGRDGLLNVFVPHATAGIAVLETGSGSDADLLAALRELLPADDRWQHRHGSPGHGRDHVVPGLVAPHATLPVIDGRLALGVWQSVVLVDTNGDNPRRTVRFSFLG
ncbi:secondary thiamine-phosphate synthase enzyme YjbQ [Kitasatospora sp. NPDC059463]|uniref:secondary thiamine-phosphate synthase enzyme YjbQ n=1 Tax=unclassified Kitasatospora TaxID=2633591 RepID=UPI0036845DDC